ncbi:PIN domain-containing protein [Burkholderia savannae]|uniref:PIN domain-containing protein n=1 Tax=Burkholderia savannae TaxID=1637837 RepID=UPI000AA94BCF|nr:PIN domain-containing protein [Burkholderia savannae]
MASGIQKLLFVDTNIWLDFYRARNEAYLELLPRLERITGKIIVTHQLESEYKRNRQNVILESVSELKSKIPDKVPSIGVLATTTEFRMLSRDIDSARKRIKNLQRKLISILENPSDKDQIYQTVHRIFHRDHGLVLTREDRHNDIRKEIRERAYRRFLHGCPPRKRNDTSFGDAINWEWMIECAIGENAELVIVSRDGDYGSTYESKSYINDHLRQEFSNRVSQKRELLLYTKVSDALRHFHIMVTSEQVKAEDDLVEQIAQGDKALTESKDYQRDDGSESDNPMASESELG